MDPANQHSNKRMKHSIVDNRVDYDSILMEKLDGAASYVYKPQSQIMSGVYKEILSALQSVLASESSTALYETASDAIAIFKRDQADSVKRKQLSELFGLANVTDECFLSLHRLCLLVSDFEDGDRMIEETRADNSGGVAITFDEEEDEIDVGSVLSDIQEIKGGCGQGERQDDSITSVCARGTAGGSSWSSAVLPVNAGDNGEGADIDQRGNNERYSRRERGRGSTTGEGDVGGAATPTSDKDCSQGVCDNGRHNSDRTRCVVGGGGENVGSHQAWGGDYLEKENDFAF